MDKLKDLLDPSYQPAKSYSDLLQEGVPNQGGLALLASAEKTASPSPSTEALQWRSPPSTSSSEPSDKPAETPAAE